MRLSYINNQSGLSLAELIIALGLTSLLLVLVVSGALFVKKYISDWSDRDKITEELAFISQELLPQIEDSRRLDLYTDSLVCHTSTGTRIRYRWDGGILSKDEHTISRVGLKVDLLEIRTNLLLIDSTIDTLSSVNTNRGLYSLKVAVSDRRSHVDTLTTVGRNRYEALKYQ